MSYLAEYLQATENEICNDVRAYCLGLQNPQDYSYLPRPGKWLSRYKQYQKTIFILALLLKIVWLCGGGFIYFTLEALSHFKKYQKSINLTDQILKFDEFAIGFSERAFQVINASSLGRNPKAWIVLPWVEIPIDERSNVFSLYSLLSPGDFFKAWQFSIRSVFVLFSSKSTTHSVLQGYTAYKWFLTRLGLARLKQGHFLTAEHFDRWTILIDSVARDLRLSTENKPESKSHVVMVQHGVLGSLTQPADHSEAEQLEIKNKLTEVEHLYVYDEGSAEVFRHSILAQECRPQVHFFKPTIELQDTSRVKGQLRILFVGHPICEDTQILIFKKLSETFSLKAYYKPHPTSAPRREIQTLGWELITDKSYFPIVDLLVSYPSTLVTEYANKSIPAVVHPINLSPDDLQDYLIQLKSEINKISL